MKNKTDKHDMVRRLSWYLYLNFRMTNMTYDRLDEEIGADDSGPPNHKQVLHPGTAEELTLHGYQLSPGKAFFYYVLSVILIGSPVLFSYWKPEWGVYWKRRKCPLSQADILIITDADGQLKVTPVNAEEVDANFDPQYAVTSHHESGVANGIQNGATDSTHLTRPVQRFMRYFVYQHIRYIWMPHKKSFSCLYGYDNNTSISSLLNDFRGFSVEEQMQRQQLYGRNVITVEVKSYINLLVTEILNPFYIFQIASIILWSFDNYVLYAACIFFVSCLSVAVSLFETRKQSQSVHDMVEASNTSDVIVLRMTSEKTTVEVQTSMADLVPGDIVVIPPNGCIMACDAVLISGNAIVNESMLTGESVPVTKTPVTASEEKEIYSAERHKRHTLFCGTEVIQTRYYGTAQVLAVVVRTGFSTAKGELVRSILYPRPLDFKFYKDAMKFIGFMFMVATIGMTYSVYIYIMHKETVIKTLVRTLDIVTIVVPPALPAAMTVGTYYAQNRLKKKGIFCISPPRINVSGKLKLVCFDKTGTLTEDGLEVWGVLEVEQGKLSAPVMDASSIGHTSHLVAGMATCHSLTYLHGNLTGDPLDVKMFEATKWTLEEASLGNSNYDQVAPTIVRPCTKESYIDPPDITNVVETAMQVPYEIGIVRQFPFSSNSQRMSVMVRVLGRQFMDLYVKGAPEVVQSLCNPETLPDDLGSILTQYTVQGFRVIALAHRTLDTKLSWHAAQRIPRDQVEKDLTFVGLLILQNMLKQETTPVIHQLKAANIRSVMVTGDNILTAISVARDCGMVDVTDSVLMAKVTPPVTGQASTLTFEPVDTPDILVQYADRTDNGDIGLKLDDNRTRYHLAVTGKAWGLICQYFPDLVPRIVARGTVFARMSPDQKAQLVEELQAIDYIVGMCGDGANDCGALKAAHVGISLSEAEASVAAPFTSRTNNIECVPRIVCEGRCALTTNFSVFKYMALYSIIQFVSVLILYTAYSNLTDPQFLYIDLFILTVLAVFMGYTGATSKLVPEKPLGNLLGAVNLFSVGSQIVLVIVAQVAAYFYLLHQSWFVPNTPTPEGEQDNTKSWETAAIFYTSVFQYLTLCIVFSPGHPFRKPIYTNVWLTISLLSLTVISLLMLMSPWPWLMDFMQIKSDPDDPLIMFRITLLLIVCIHFVLSLSVEHFLASSRFLKKFFQWVTCKRVPKNKYKHVLQDMEEDCSWPPIGTVIHGTHEA
ncbi:polyamine-transporting ATPase 13A3-like isoform X6 [Palaemon carinicauda]|uniref:polyamine-transporting ATPase 13A3-like isoform X6 n=1 Tax=Palaemon carinicauda TaxID=392227 RepID=UPI0035B6A020